VEHYPLLYEDAKGDGGIRGPSPETDLQKGDHPSLLDPAGHSPAEDDRAGRLGVLLLGNAKSEMPGKRLIRKRDMY